jgi:hypothetical protein
MRINFDARGNIKPHQKIEVSLETFRKNFVDDFAYDYQRRMEIFQNYKNFLPEFKQEITEDFIQWIGGSFVTKKKAPRDIDFVTLIDYKSYEKYEAIIESKYRRQPARSIFGLVDAYVVKIYPLDHSRCWVSEYDLVYWRRLFSETKKNRAKKKFAKGFIEIKFGNA